MLPRAVLFADPPSCGVVAIDVFEKGAEPERTSVGVVTFAADRDLGRLLFGWARLVSAFVEEPSTSLLKEGLLCRERLGYGAEAGGAMPRLVQPERNLQNQS